MVKERRISIKTQEELEVMRRAGRMTAEVLRLLQTEAKPGVATRKLDEIAEEWIRSEGGEPAFKGYYGYPASICASVNEEVVHGIPGFRVLKEGDIVGIDVGVKLDGFCADAARTLAVGVIEAESRRLMEVTQEALAEGIRRAVEGNRLQDISWAVQSCVEGHGFSVVREYVGHGIGRELHEEPQVPNFGKPHTGPLLVAGMTLAIEPMVNMGTFQVEVLSDGWTVVTKDRRRSSHFEETVIVGTKEAEVITR
ncbi:MAG: type I methionyl aminopeptidase [Candidatus Omnitrophica bacterium]|nr:type I methionyl aminopeptidase [Candidatus Omnitrophota bacterium]